MTSTEMDPRARAILGMANTFTNYVRPVYWIGQCPLCGEDSPEMRDSPEQAQQDIDDCPCRSDRGQSWSEVNGDDDA